MNERKADVEAIQRSHNRCWNTGKCECHADIPDLIHDLRLADAEIEGLRRIEKREAEHDCFKWLDGWIELYESDGPADGKAQGFIDWVNRQPMSGGG